MILLTILFGCLFLPQISLQSQLFQFLDLPQPDNVNRICQLDSANNTTSQFIVDHSNGLVLLLKDPNEPLNHNENWAQVAAHHLSVRNITFCQVNVNQPSSIGNASDVVVFLNGKKLFYYGKRSSVTLISFIEKVNTTSQLPIITGKIDKIAFDKVPGPKVVGFFMTETPDFIAFKAAAEQNPLIPFYVILDRIVAKHLKLQNVGQINLVKEKVYLPCPVNPATTNDIETFIGSNKGFTIKPINEFNLFDPQFQQNKTNFIVIGEESSAIGNYFHKLLTKMIRNLTKQAEQDKLAQQQNLTTLDSTPTTTQSAFNLNDMDVLWLDPRVFPSIYIMRDQFEQFLGLTPNLKFHFGTINVVTNETNWFDTTLINATAEKKTDEINVQLLKEWILNVTAKPQEMQPKISFVNGSKQIEVNESMNFTLSCLIENQHGNCFWLHNGQTISLNHAQTRHSLRSNVKNGDCSLEITNANAQDSGEWVCGDLGDQNNPLVASLPILVSVSTSTKTEL